MWFVLVLVFNSWVQYRSNCVHSGRLRKNIIGLLSLVGFGVLMNVNRKQFNCCCGQWLHLKPWIRSKLPF